jgi:hypothetical protein
MSLHISDARLASRRIGGQAASIAAFFMSVDMVPKFWVAVWGAFVLAGSYSRYANPHGLPSSILGVTHAQNQQPIPGHQPFLRQDHQERSVILVSPEEQELQEV